MKSQFTRATILIWTFASVPLAAATSSGVGAACRMLRDADRARIIDYVEKKYI